MSDIATIPVSIAYCPVCHGALIVDDDSVACAASASHYRPEHHQVWVWLAERVARWMPDDVAAQNPALAKMRERKVAA